MAPKTNNTSQSSQSQNEAGKEKHENTILPCLFKTTAIEMEAAKVGKKFRSSLPFNSNDSDTDTTETTEILSAGSLSDEANIPLSQKCSGVPKLQRTHRTMKVLWPPSPPLSSTTSNGATISSPSSGKPADRSGIV